MRRGVMVVATALAAVAAGTLAGAEASGDSTVVIRGSAIPSGAKAQLNLVGCASVFGRTAETIAPRIGVVAHGPAGKRSLGFDLAGGNAIGSVSYVDRVAATTVAGMTVHADAGTTGVAYVGYQAPRDVGTSLMWIGRASLSVGAGTWTPVNVPGLGYAWTQYDMSTQQPIGGEVGSSGVPAFVQAMGGDGAGFYMVGFGCDGNAFNTDAWRIGTLSGAMTYDFEGYTTRTTIAGPDAPIEPGARATLTGTVTDGNGSPLDGRAVLEAKQDNGSWDTVDVAPGPRLSAVVRPEETTTYRWKFFDRARYEASTSDPFKVTVQDPDEPGEEPTADPSDGPTEPPPEEPAGAPSAPATAEAATEEPVAPPPESAAPPAEAPPVEPTVEETPPPVEEPTQPDPPAADPPAADPPAADEAAPAGSGAEAPAG